MVSVLGEKMISISGGGSSGSLASITIRNELQPLLGELDFKELDGISGFLDRCHHAIILRDDDSIDEPTIIDAGRGVLTFNSRLVQGLRQKHGPDISEKLRELLRPLLKGLVKQANDAIASTSARDKEASQAFSERTAERERQRELQLQRNPFYLIDELTKRVEKLEAKR